MRLSKIELREMEKAILGFIPGDELSIMRFQREITPEKLGMFIEATEQDDRDLGRLRDQVYDLEAEVEDLQYQVEDLERDLSDAEANYKKVANSLEDLQYKEAELLDKNIRLEIENAKLKALNEGLSLGLLKLHKLLSIELRNTPISDDLSLGLVELEKLVELESKPKNLKGDTDAE